jgi:hypothetical protein
MAIFLEKRVMQGERPIQYNGQYDWQGGILGSQFFPHAGLMVSIRGRPEPIIMAASAMCTVHSTAEAEVMKPPSCACAAV